MEFMSPRGIPLAVALALTVLGAIHAYQRGGAGERPNQKYFREMQSPADSDPPDAWQNGEFAFARLRYPQFNSGGRGGGRGFGRYRRSSWGTDSNTAERHLLEGVRRLTRIDARSVEEIIEADSDDVYKFPWLYAVEVGHWELTDPQAKRLREYLDRGGFLMVDDFHDEDEWEVFMASLVRVFPDRTVVDLPESDPIFHSVYDLEKKFQVPGYQYVHSGRTYERGGTVPHWRGIYDDKGRVQVAICHNMDLGDAWEWSDSPDYPEHFAGLAYRIGMNYIVYSMSH